MTKFGELIYNTHLKLSRTKQNKPFRFRQDFTDFEKDPNYVYILKLEAFFKKFPHIKVSEFLEAPYLVYPEQTYYSLDFYLTQKAIKVYTIFNKQKTDAAPDSQLQIDFIKKSLEFIYKFCKEKKITIAEYINDKTELLPSFLMHLKEHNISIYALFGWNEFESVFSKLDQEEVKFVLGHIYDNLGKYRTMWFQSVKAKKIVKEGIKILINN
jgi:L-rhamnose mutarotase